MNKPTDAEIDALAEALQDAWNDFCADTGCFPDVLTVTRGPRITANFESGNFVRMVANCLTANGFEVARSETCPHGVPWPHAHCCPPVGKSA